MRGHSGLSGGLVFLAKELREILRTSRIYVVPGLFLFFGLTSPILTKLMPEIVKAFASQAGGVQIILPPQTGVDSFLQFFKNLTQIGVIALILTFMGSVAEERNRGTAILTLTKPVSRVAFVVAKFLAATLLLVFATAIAYGVALYYTMYLFPATPRAESLAAAVLYLVYGVFIVALTVSASAIARSQVSAAGLALAAFFAVSLLPTFGGWLATSTPGALPSFFTRVLMGTATLGQALPAISVSLAVSAGLVVLGSLAFARQEL
jgi:ABC-2 type transport system permease protein